MDIKPCPFCGGRARKRTIHIKSSAIIKSRPDGTQYYSVKDSKIERTPDRKRRMIECREKDCLLRPSTWLHLDTTNFKDAIKAWNVRTTIS